MRKKIRLNTVSLGSEPDQPDILSLSRFIGTCRGRRADLLTFKLIQSLSAQTEAGITTPGAGGIFYGSRIEPAITCSSDEYFRNSSDVLDDMVLMTDMAGPVRSILPAPHLLHSSPDPTDEERYADYCDQFAGILRDMRDNGITGHIIHAKEAYQIEIELIASQKTWIVIPGGEEKVQESLLEHQHRMALHNPGMRMLADLVDRYDIRHLTIMDPVEESIRQAFEFLDPDQISVGGYAISSEEGYWNELVKKSLVPLPQDTYLSEKG
jgi:hypothetical protein